MHNKRSTVRSKVTRHPVPQRVKVQVRQQPVTHEQVFLSGGIGDVFAVESFLSDRDREQMTTIHYGTSKREPIAKLWSALPNYPRLKDHNTLWDDFSNFWCFFSLQDCIFKMDRARMAQPPKLRAVRDLSIIPFFDKIKRGEVPYNNSSFISHTVADAGRFKLPDRYVAICPFSNDKRLKSRDFNGNDWTECLKFLKKVNAQGVVLNAGDDQVPTAPDLINLNNGTDILEAVEILKRGVGYIGIDSALSVLAAKLFLAPSLMIKSNNEHCYHNLQCYYAPHSDFSFVVRNIKCPDDL